MGELQCLEPTGWGSCLVIVNMASSSVCPALRTVPRGKGWLRQISGGVPLCPFPCRVTRGCSMQGGLGVGMGLWGSGRAGHPGQPRPPWS